MTGTCALPRTSCAAVLVAIFLEVIGDRLLPNSPSRKRSRSRSRSRSPDDKKRSKDDKKSKKHKKEKKSKKDKDKKSKKDKARFCLIVEPL